MAARDDSIRCGCAGVHARVGRASMSARSALFDSGRRHRSTRAPMARPASTSVVQCASKTIRVAAMRPPSAHASGADFRIDPGDGGRDRADMHGMARRKRIVGFARTGNAMAAAMDHAPIRPFLVDQPLQKMRQDGGPRSLRAPDDRFVDAGAGRLRAKPAKGLLRSQRAGVHRRPRSKAERAAPRRGLHCVRPPSATRRSSFVAPKCNRTISTTSPRQVRPAPGVPGT